jgi:hypothetical protein
MEKERRALMDEAARCRRTARDLNHPKAAKRLKTMAEEYEIRAARLFKHAARRGIVGASQPLAPQSSMDDVASRPEYER